MDKRMNMMNHNSLDLSLLSDSSSDTQTNTAGDFGASENCTLLLENDKKSVHDGVLHRITHFTKRSGSRFRREFCNDDDDDDDGDNRNDRFYAASRQLHRKTAIKRYLFLFGFISTVIIFSQLCLSLYNYESDVEGLFTMKISLHFFPFNCVCIFFRSINRVPIRIRSYTHKINATTM